MKAKVLTLCNAKERMIRKVPMATLLLVQCYHSNSNTSTQPDRGIGDLCGMTTKDDDGLDVADSRLQECRS